MGLDYFMGNDSYDNREEDAPRDEVKNEEILNKDKLDLKDYLKNQSNTIDNLYERQKLYINLQKNFKNKFSLNNNSKKINVHNNIKTLFMSNVSPHKKSKILSLDSASTIDDDFIYNINESCSSYFNDCKGLRNSYYEKLISKKIMTFEREPKVNSLFIFDWDDTLFFTTYLYPEYCNKKVNLSIENKEKERISEIETLICQIMNKALSKGSVFIITNSEEGWVEESTKLFYPNLVPFLDKINIISSRKLYSKDYPSDREMWKLKTFTDLRKIFNFNPNFLTNIICIGDNEIEIKAGKKLAEQFKNCFLKTVKFRERPSLKELIKQLKLIDNQILRVYSYPKNLSIQVEKKNRKNSGSSL